MGKLICLLLTMQLFSFVAEAQVQGMQWKKIIGSNKYESFDKIIPAKDGGYLLMGGQYGDINNYRTDLWLVKVNKVGAVEWQKKYGGTDEEWGSAGIATADGGFIVVGATCSIQNDGDVTGHHGLDTTIHDYYWEDHMQDIWVLKINATGDIVWKKAFGGSRWDDGNDIIKTADNNYMIVGTSYSVDGDLTGMRRSTIAPDKDGESDMWLFKIDETGNLLWQKCYGGNYRDGGCGIVPANEGFLITGWTSSNDLDVTGLHSSFPGYYDDCWMVNINAAGDIQWAKTFGGSGFDYAQYVVPYNNGYLIAASTTSNDGDVLGYHAGDNNPQDLWLFEIGENGNLNWQTTIGTAGDDGVNELLSLPDGMVMLTGYSGPFRSPNPSPLIIKLDKARSIVYQKVFDNLKGLDLQCLASSGSNNYLIAGSVNPDYYKFPEDHLYGKTDGLLLKFGDANTITGKVFFDNNANNTYDNGEPPMNNIKVTSSKGGAFNYGSFTNSGIFSNSVDTGNYSTSAYIDNPNFTITPVAKNSSFASYFNADTINYAVTALVPASNDLAASLIPLRPVRPGFEVKYKVQVLNKGTTTQDAVVKLVKDHRLSFVSSVPAVQSAINDTVTWQIQNFPPLGDSSLSITMQVAAPPVVNIGDSIKLRVVASPLAGDLTPGDNADTVKQWVFGSFDPNDKTESHGGTITPAQISGADPLTYTIRFQNTGTDTAFNITIRDTLESRLSWNSLQMISASHPYQLTIEDGNKLTWQFNNIKLPYTGIDEPNSHGYIAYRI